MPKRRVFVVGVGMTKFEKPGSRDWDYPEMAKEAAEKAFLDAGIDFKEIQQRAVYPLGMTGVPIYNVNNNCATGSTALYMAKQFVEGGLAECVLALGFEKMQRGSLKSQWDDRTNPLDQHMMKMMEQRGYEPKAPPAPQIFGNAGREHMEKYGTTAEQIAKIAEKNHRHSVNNPYSQFRDEYTLAQILQSKKVYEPLTMLQCCPTSEGAACAILCSEEFVLRHGLQGKAVEVAAMALVTDTAAVLHSETPSMGQIAGSDMTRLAAGQVFREAGVKPGDVGVVELHDCFSANELITYEALGLCEEGKAGAFIDSGANTYGGRVVVNPSGGLISKGHPLGATGLAQVAELTWQLRQMAGKRQVAGLRYALQHNLGLGGAAVVALYKLGFPEQFQPYTAAWNPAVTAEPPPVAPPARL